MKIKIGPYRKNRAFNIHIDDFDVWSLDHTLACIIHPALIRLKETKHGYPELWEDGMVTHHNYDRQLHFDFIDEGYSKELTLDIKDVIICGKYIHVDAWFVDADSNGGKVEMELYWESVGS